MKDLREILRGITDKDEEPYSVVGTVKDLDVGQGTCTITPISDESDISGVRLQATEGFNKGFRILPKLGSKVIVTFLNSNTGFISATTEVDKFRIASEDEDLKTLLEDTLSTANSSLSLIQSILTDVGLITVTSSAPATPTSIPINAAAFINHSTSAGNIITEITNLNNRISNLLE